MSGNKDFTYEDLGYDDHLFRDERFGAESGVMPSMGSGISYDQKEAEKGKKLANLWVDTWIKSRNYQPKKRGFLIEGRRGYIECMQLVAISGYFGNTTDGININDNGLEIIGDGYIRTSSTDPKLEILKNASGGFTNALRLWNTNSDLLFRISDSGSPCLYMMGTDSVGPASFLNNSSTCEFASVNVSAKGLQNGIHVATSGSVARSALAAVYIDNSSTYGMGMYAKHGSNSVDDLIHLKSNLKRAELLAIEATSWTAVHAARITNTNYIQFPAYYHCSEFDEQIGGSTAISASVIANAHWTGSGTNGTQTLEEGSVQDENTYVKLSTTATANSDSVMTFGRLIPTENQVGIEGRYRITSKTNTAVLIGLSGGGHKIQFRFDTDTDADNIYAEATNAGGTTTTDTEINSTTSIWHTYRIQVISTTAYFYIDDALRVTMTTNIPNTTHMNPFFSVDNKAAAEEKIMYLDYYKIWTGRDDTSNPI